MVLKPFYLALKHVFRRTFTIKYPYVMLKLPERPAGRHLAHTDLCVNCGICATTCPTGAMEMVEAEGKKWPVVNYGKCCFCQLCVEFCPRKAVEATNEYELSTYDKTFLVYTMERLSVPPEIGKGRKIVTVKFRGNREVFHE